MPKIDLVSFARGEISPELYGRVDTSQYETGLALAKNIIIHTYGGASNRPGTRFLAPVKDHSVAPRLVPFEFSIDDTYILEFGEQYMRVMRNDAHIVENTSTISAITLSNPLQITATGHGLSVDDEVVFQGIVGTTELNRRRYLVNTVVDANNFTLKSQVDGTPVDGTSDFSTYISGGEVARIFEISTPYSILEVRQFTYAQTADIMTIAHNNHPPFELRRLADDNWTLTQAVFTSEQAFPRDLSSFIESGSGSDIISWKITAVSSTGIESLPGTNLGQTITSITNASPGVVTTSAPHSLVEGEEVLINDVLGMTEINNRRFLATNITATTYELFSASNRESVDTTNFQPHTASTGRSRRTQLRVTTDKNNIDVRLLWQATDGAETYNIYRQSDNGLFGFVGETTENDFTDNDNIEPNTDQRPPKYIDPFEFPNQYPAAVSFFEQRKVFAGALDTPDTSDFSRTADFNNFALSNPVQDDDPITATLSSGQLNQIRHILSLRDLLLFTSGGEWRVTSGNDTAFTSNTIRQFQQSRWGIGELRPLVFDNQALFVTADNSNVRSLAFTLGNDGYQGEHLNLSSRHLTDGFTIIDWAVTYYPEGRVYMVRDDGVALCLTFDREHNIRAWSQWRTDGSFESVQSLRTGGRFNEDSTYWVVRRVVDGEVVRYIEVSRQRFIDDVRDAFFVDSGLSLDVPITITSITSTNPVVITAASHGLLDNDEIDISGIIWDENQDNLNNRRYNITNVTTNTFELIEDGSSFSTYISGGVVRKTVNQIRGLSHLEGQTVSVLADGNVTPKLVVSNGMITLPGSFSRIHVGLPYEAQINSLPIFLITSQGSFDSQIKKINKVFVKYFKSRGIEIGNTLDTMVEVKDRQAELLSDPISLFSGNKQITLDSRWDRDAQIYIRQSNPLPMTIIGLTPEFETSLY